MFNVALCLNWRWTQINREVMPENIALEVQEFYRIFGFETFVYVN